MSPWDNCKELFLKPNVIKMKASINGARLQYVLCEIVSNLDVRR